jgi:hypothetical protein
VVAGISEVGGGSSVVVVVVVAAVLGSVVVVTCDVSGSLGVVVWVGLVLLLVRLSANPPAANTAAPVPASVKIKAVRLYHGGLTR